ncbi:MAG: biotin--[acetyl-CoA-carboxylase] ligase [Haliscomenobacteraceae bacterium CHB4]|nr:Bifunctional ligase/repressor BirA [Saprospiraceae bacterium]MCE7921430.1 biotin--[acetyl-CoA-carboxylase] ligase [Haliscomenobacteraceae bacterium CHB4]
MTNTLFIGKVYHRFDELTSTNDWAAELLAKSKPPEGTVVRADSQSAGRGQFGSRWESAAGQNLTLSVVLYPVWLEAQAQFYLSMAVALSLHDLAEALSAQSEIRNPPSAIKWPNDLYLGNRKTAGILIQNTLSGQYLQSSIVGIGLNVNQLEFDASLPNPTSLALYCRKEFDLDEVAERLFGCLERRYMQLKSGQRTAIREEYERSLYRIGEAASFVRTADGAEFSGVIRGVTEAGRLRVETEGGEETFEVKEVQMVM